MESSTEMHLSVAKIILHYLEGIKDLVSFFKKDEKSHLIGFTNSDFVGDQDDNRSTSYYVFMFNIGVVSWSSKNQPIITLPTSKLNLLLLQHVLAKPFS